jgi:spermidine/putrescine transport system permease protein
MRPSRWLDAAFLLPGVAILIVLFVVPMVFVAVYSFGTINIVGLPQLGFTTINYENVFQPYYVPTITRTVEYAALTTVICIALGYPLAYFATRFAGGWAKIIIAAIILTWVVDYLVRIYAWSAILNSNGFVNRFLVDIGVGRQDFIPSTTAVIAGLVYGYLPLTILPIYASLGDLDTELIDAGKDLYGAPRQTFLHVTLPATSAGIIGGAVLTFFPALGDFATAQFLGGPNQAMIGNLISQQFTGTGSIPFGAALTMVLLMMLFVGIGLLALVSRRGFRRASGRITREVVRESMVGST